LTELGKIGFANVADYMKVGSDGWRDSPSAGLSRSNWRRVQPAILKRSSRIQPIETVTRFVAAIVSSSPF
jgi:hypothetical protein